MPAQTMTLSDVLTVDDQARAISNFWITWNALRQQKVQQWKEIRDYVYATDTSTTSNSVLPWKNKTTSPKLTQIFDNLISNYVRSLFPKRKWLVWEGFDQTSEDLQKREAIENYMMYAVEQSDFKSTVTQLMTDWVLTGNCFVMPEWYDGRVQLVDKQQVGYVGPRAKRIDPLDIVFNPIASDFASTPKILRKWVTLGDLKAEISRLSPSEEHSEELWNYLVDLRRSSSTTGGAAMAADIGPKDDYLSVDGFGTFQQYLDSDYAEVLTFYGDLFIRETGEFLQNHVVTIVDRHKVIAREPNQSFFGTAPIYHSGWRERPDNLWAMGPLDNLVGLQYRIDHLENLKADILDLHVLPPLKIKGYVEDFTWGPMERIYTDADSDVESMAPDWSALNANMEINDLMQKMEEMAGAPKEAMGIRSPGEKTAYEVQRLESASGRIFQTRLEHFEDLSEQILSAMLELARRKVTSQQLRIFDDELKVATFQTLTSQDITGNGRLRPVAAKHFAERAERVQNVTALFNSAVGQDQAVNVHFSGLEMAKMFEDILDLKGYHLVTPFVRIAETQEAQQLMQSAQEQNIAVQQTPSGLTPDDMSASAVNDVRQAAINLAGKQNG